jgi:hypothetical protein
MSNLRRVIVAACLLTNALLVIAQTTGQLSRSATSTITSERDKEGNDVITTTNRRFTFADWTPNYQWPDPANRWMILLEEFSSEWYPGMEGTNGSVKVESWIGHYPHADRKGWTIGAEGDEGEVESYFYKVTKYGCCATHQTQMYFNLMTGRKAYTSTNNLHVILRPYNSSLTNRYVAYHDANSMIQPQEAKSLKNLIGVIQYGSEKEALQRVLIRFLGAEWQERGTPKVRLKYQGKLYERADSRWGELSLMGKGKNADRSFFSDFSVGLMWSGGGEVEIPVENDTLQPGKARILGKMMLEEVK